MSTKREHMKDSINRKQLIKDLMHDTEQKLYRNPEVVIVCALALPAVWLFFVLCLVL
jgi:hypothetical protein